jgi:hypothetical protein
MIPASLTSIIMLAIWRDVVGKAGANLRGVQEPENRSNMSANRSVMSIGGLNLSLGPPYNPNTPLPYTKYEHQNCYAGHGGSSSGDGFYATQQECESYNKP